MTPDRYFALIPAAGIGARLGASYPKQYVPLAGKPMLLHALDTFAASAVIAHIFVVVSEDDGYIQSLLQEATHLAERMTVIYCGGATRQMSVLNGLQAIRHEVAEQDWILVHDAARPGLTCELIERLVREVGDDDVGGLLALPVVDTLKRSNDEGRAESTIPREQLWAAQTPQMFRYTLLSKALLDATNVTDEASAVEALGLKPRLVQGSVRNFKVTMPNDIPLAEILLKEMK